MEIHVVTEKVTKEKEEEKQENKIKHRHRDYSGRGFYRDQKEKENKIAQGDINIFSHINIRGYVPFSKFCRLYRK